MLEFAENLNLINTSNNQRNVLLYRQGCIPISHMLLAELFPSDIRALSIGITQSIALGFGAMNIKLYPLLVDRLQFHGTFYMYASVQFLALLWGSYTIPDNRGLSLVRVEENYEEQKSDKTKKWKHKKINKSYQKNIFLKCSYFFY